jgi:hypothetical protein
MINYTWKFNAFDCTPDKVVTSIHWRYKGVNENNTSYETYGVIGVGLPDYENFTDFENLTYEQVCSWIENLVDVEIMQNNISEQIALLEQPKTITLNPPF